MITAKVKAKLAAEDEFLSFVKIIVNTDSKGGVLLRGFAKTQADSDKATLLARGTEGVTAVVNHIEIASP